MTRKIKTVFSTFKEMWKYSKEATELTKGFSPWIARFMYLSSIWKGLRTLGLISLATGAYSLLESRGIKVQDHIPTLFWIWGGVLMGAGILSGLLRVYLIRKRTAFKHYVEDHFTDIVHKKLTSLSLGDRISGEFKTLYRRTGVHDAIQLTEKFFEMRFGIITAVVSMTAALVALSLINFWIFLSIMIPAIISVRLRAQAYRRHHDQRDFVHHIGHRKSEYESVVTRAVLYIQNSFFRTLAYFRGAFETKRKEERVHELRLEELDARADVVMGWINTIPILVFCASISSYINNMDFSRVLLLFGCYTSLRRTMFQTFGLYNNYHRQALEMRDWKDFISLPSSIDETACTTYATTKSPRINLNNLIFTYPGKTEPALNNINLTILPGQAIALVGHNGSGKSTLIALLTKVYLPQTGTLTYDGRSTHTIRQTDISKFLCWIAGNCDLLELPLYEAVCGCSREDVDWDRLRKAASITGANQYVERLPHGWDTSMDTTDQDHTHGFSDGQKQRLNLTAALYRALHPEVTVIIFDEPMAHCDTEVKKEFYTSIQKLGKTVIAAIHDPGFHHLFDRVITLADGHVTSDVTK